MTPTATIEKNASGRKWSAGPYVRVAERETWDDFYREFADELRVSRHYPQGATLTEQQIDVLAFNCAYLAVWTLREDNTED
jgi:hypothetical protein